MKVHVIFAQRKQNYAGQYALESVACMTEIEADDNPDYLREKLKESQDCGEFDYCGIVTLEVSEAQIRRRLLPDQTAIPASVSDGDGDG